MKLFSKIATLFAGIAMAVAVGVGINSGGNDARVNAASTESFTVTFKDNGTEGDGSSALTTSSTLSSFISEGVENFATTSPITTTSKVYLGKKDCGLKFGGSSDPGSLTLAFKETLKKITTIVVNVQVYNSSKNSGLSINGVSQTVSKNNFSSFGNLTYTINKESQTSLQIVTSKPSSGDYRVYIKQIVVNYEATPVVPLDSFEISCDKTKLEVGEDLEFSYFGLNTDGDEWKGKVTYESTNSEVASFSSNVLTAKSTGTTTITAKAIGAGEGGIDITSDNSIVITITAPVVKEFEKYSGSLTEGAYIIYSSGQAMNNVVSNSRLQYASVTPSNNIIIPEDDSIIWEINKNGDYWNIYSKTAKKYAASTGAANKAQLLDSADDKKSLWTCTGETSYEFINLQNKENNVNKNLRCNGEFGFACYGTGTGGSLSLYKLKETKVPEELAIEGNFLKTAYGTDENWDPSGLTVSSYYDDGSDEDVTDKVEWSFTPEKPAVGVISVVATASYTFNNVTVTGDSNPQSVTVTTADEVVVTGVSITDPATSPIDIDGTKKMGDNVTLTAQVSYQSGTGYKPGNNKVEWSSSDEDVMTIDSTGKATFIGDGETIITATSLEDDSYSASVTYNVSLKGFSKEYPLGVDEAVNAYSTLKDKLVFITGTISEFVTIKSGAKFAMIKDTSGSKEVELYTYQSTIKTDPGVSLDDYIVGSTVVASGKFTLYSSTYELADFDKDSGPYTTIHSIATEPINSITIKSKPKVAYNYGDTFDPTGLVITASRTIGGSKDYAYSSTSDKFSFNPELGTELTNQTKVTVTYEGKSADLTITVTKVLDTIKEDASSTVETSYFEDDKFDPTGLVITTNYQNEAPSGTVEYNDTTKSKFGFEPSLSTALTAADDIVTVSYTENGVTKSFDLDIEVAAPGTKAVEVTTQPGKVSYYEGDEFDPSGLVLTLTLENDKTTTVAYNDTTADDFSFTYDGSAINPGDVLDTVGDNQEISVTYDGATSATGKGIKFSVTEVVVEIILVTTLPDKVTYDHGESFDPTGLVITAMYNNEDEEEIPYTEGCGMTFDKDELSYTDTKVTVSYEGCDDDIAIKVNRVIDDVEFISIKDTYVVDQKFDPSNLEVELSFTDEGPTEVITYADNPELFTDFDPALDLPLKADDTSISFKIKGHTATHELTVNNRTMISATIKTEQAKDTYFRGESFDASGLVIHAVYNDGSEDDIAYASGSTAWTFAPATFEEVGDDVPVSISYNNISCGEVVVTVNEVVLSSISVKTAPTKLEYDFGEKFAPEGLEIELLFNNGSKETVTYAGHESEFTFNPGLDHELTHDDHAITITYQEKTTTQDITVNKVKSSAEVTANPTKTTYVEGTYFNPAGLEATITFSDNSTEVVKFNDNPERFTDWSIPVEQKLSVSDEKVTFKVDGFALEVNITVVPASVTSIAVKEQPKVTYNYDEAFDPTGLVITASFDNGTTQDVAYNNETKDAFTFSIAPGTKLTHEDTEVSITYASKSTTLSLTIDKVVTSIEVASMPSKVTYTVGETFDSTGLTIKANYSDESNALVTGYSLSEVDMSTPGNKTITVTYEGKTCEFNITVNEAPAPVKTLVSIAVTHMPNKVEYEVGDTFNRDGLEITATYSDETTAVITDYAISSPDMSTPGNKTVTVTYQQKTCEFTITVKQPAPVKTLESIEVSKLPNKVEYNIGETFDPTGLEVTAKYSDGSSEKVTGYTLSTVDMTSAGSKSVTVTYETKTTSFNITVKEAPAPVVTLTGISATEPTKEYNVGDTIAPEDITVKATYSDGSSKNVTGWTSGQITKVSDTQGQVTISYTEGEVTKSTIIFVNIKQEQPAPKPLGCGGSVIAASGLVSIVSLLGASLLVLKKRKEK